MKDVIEEQRKELLTKLHELTGGLASDLGLRSRINLVVDESLLKIANEADFIINRLKGEAGIIERASAKMPRTAELLVKMAQILKGYAARVENSQAPEFQEKRIIRLSEFNGE